MKYLIYTKCLIYTILIYILLELIFHSISVKRQLNNACTNYRSYFNIYFSSECYYIPDNSDDVPEIIKRHIGKEETHEVVTEDGYILTLFRIPHENPKEVIFLQHGISVDSSSWVSQYNESIAFFFWKSGYDVWLGNNRGTFYSKKHINLSSDAEEFWDYSIEELGYYDLDASIDYVKEVTKFDKIVYVGYSLGSTTSAVYASLRPEKAANSTKVIIQLAPMGIAKFVASPIKYILPNLAFFVMDNNLNKFFKVYSFTDYNSWYLQLTRLINRYFPFKEVLVYMVSFFVGWTPSEMDPNYINLFVDKLGSAVSWKTLHHTSQIYKYGGDFKRYHYGKENNLKIYGSEEPPPYPLQNITTPIFIIHSREDSFSYFKDVEYYYDMLPENSKIYGKKEVRGLNHNDFLFGKSRNKKIYNVVLKLIDHINLLPTSNFSFPKVFSLT